MTVASIDSVFVDGIAIPTSLESLDAVVLVCLVDRFGEKVMQWRGPLAAEALITYALVDESGWTRLGPLGQLWLRKIDDRRVNLRAVHAALPSNAETLAYLAGWPYRPADSVQTPFFANSKLRQQVIQELTAADPTFDPWFQESDVVNAVSLAIDAGREGLQAGRTALFITLVQDILERLRRDGTWQAVCLEPVPGLEKPWSSTQPGNPGLAPKEQIYRVALAMWAEELRQQDPSKPWKEIARQIHWPYSLKLLEDARSRLVRSRKVQDSLYTEACVLAEQLKRKP